MVGELRLKILILTSSYLPKVNGVTRTVSTIADGLIRRGHEVVVVTKWREGLSREAVNEGARVARVGSGRRFGEAFFFLLSMTRFAAVSRMKGECDVIHAHGTLPGLAALVSHLITKSPFVCSFHQDALIGWETGYRLSGIRVALGRFLQSLICNWAGFVTVQSTTVGDITRRVLKLKRGERIVVIPNPVNTSRFKPLPGNQPDVRTTLLFVGNLIRRKGVDVLIRALPEIIKRSSNVNLVIVGTGPEGDALARLCETLGVGGKVTFAKEVKDDDLVLRYSNAAVVVLPSQSEVFGNVLAEALAMQKSVVATATVGALSIISDGISGRVVPIGDQVSLANAITDTLADKERAARMASFGYNTVQADFSSEAVARKLEVIYMSLTSSRPIQNFEGKMLGSDTRGSTTITAAWWYREVDS